MAPVVGGTVVAPLTDSVWRADALACGSVAIIPHVTALTGWKTGQKVSFKCGRQIKGSQADCMFFSFILVNQQFDLAVIVVPTLTKK